MSDWKVLNSKFYSNGGVNFGLLYNTKTGDFQIKQRSILGEFNSPGLATLYENGRWYGDALRINELFTYQSGDTFQSNPIATDKSKELNAAARRQVYAAFQSGGGNTKGLKVNSAALPQNQGGTAGVTNTIPGSSPGITSSIPALTNPPGSGGLFDLLTPGLPNPGDFPSLANPAFKKTLLYPLDLLENQQDTLQITQVEYQSPNQDIFTSKISDILTKGLQRTSVKKNILGKVILPIPNTPQDSNNVAWGDDSMDAFTTAATAAIVQNPAGYAGGLLAGQGAGALLSSLGLPGAGNLAKSAPPAILRAYLLSQATENAAVKASLYSYILSKYQFEVSPESILSRGLGVVPNSNLQLLFNNVTLRQFQFSYMMSPRSEAEASNVNMILRFFKQGMAAKKGNVQAGGASIFLKTPNVFKLEYKSGRDSISGMNKFKICALTGFGVNYAPSGQWAAYDKGQPSSVVMTMSFKEIEPVFESDYQNNKGDISFDIPPVKETDIGY